MSLRPYRFLIIAASLWLPTLILAEPPYKLNKKVALIGDSGWDYLTLDSTSRKLYVAHGTRVNIFDVDQHKSLGTLANTPGVHAIAIAEPFNRGFITQGKTDSVVAFDLKTMKKIGESPTGKSPDAVLYDPFSQQVLVFNTQSQNITLINPQKIETIGTIPLSGKPEWAVADGKGNVFVNIRDQNSIAQINSKTMRVDKSIVLSTCKEPTSLAMDVGNGRLFVGCANKVMAVVDIASEKTITTLTIGDRVDFTYFDSNKNFIFNSSNDGTVTVIKQESPKKYRVQEIIQTQIGARTGAFDPKTNTLFLAVAEFGPLPAPTAENPRPKQQIVPNTFNILVISQ